MPKAKLLIVEDDVTLLSGLKDIFELDDYACMTAENGKQALDLMHRHQDDPPDLIVSDVMMPHMDGYELLQRIRQNERWITIPFIFLTAKGEKHDIHQGKFLGVDEYMTKPFDADDLLVAVQSRLQRQRAINQAQAGMVSNLKRSILTILNHEFRTPLTLVVAYADMLKDYNTDDMTHEQLLEFLKGVNSGADRLRRLIENFILLVELETGDTQRTYDWRHQRIKDPSVVIYQGVENYNSGRQYPRAFEVVVPDKLPPLTGDVEFLGIALRELLDNAVKFSPKESPVEVGAAVVNNVLHIWVRDFGRGIPMQEFDNIWKQFYQIDRDHHEDQGSGVGLSIAKGIIDLHGGEITVESRVNSGSTFTIKLPLP